MNRQANSVLFLLMCAIFLGIAALLLQPQKSDGLARVHMLNVGQGDSFLVQAANGTQLLIDAGRDSMVLTELSRVMPRGDRSIDVVLATHPDADHIGGLPTVLSRYDVGLFLTSEVSADTKAVEKLYATLVEENIPSYYVRSGMMLSLDDTSTVPANFAVLFPDRNTKNWDTNTASVVGRLQLGPRSMLFTGDSPSSIEKYLIAGDAQNIDTDILKLGHHGSKTSTSEAFLRATTPVLALISAGVDNSYGHPHPEVTGLLQAIGIRTISTQDRGTVTLTTDGVKWAIGK